MSFEDFLDKFPVIGAFTKSDEEKALLKKQEQMAAEARKRYVQARETSMNGLSQQLIGLAPHNQMMAQMFGPQAAFSPEQMGQMVQNPLRPELDPSLVNYTGLDPDKQRQVEEYLAAKRADEERRKIVEGAFGAGGPRPRGPAPLRPVKPMPAPQDPRGRR